MLRRSRVCRLVIAIFVIFSEAASRRPLTAAESPAELAPGAPVDVAAVPMLTATDEVDGVVITRDGAGITCVDSVGCATQAAGPAITPPDFAAQTLLSPVRALPSALAPVSELAVRRSALGALVVALSRVSRSGFTRDGPL